MCFADNILGPTLDLHGAQVHHAQGQVCAGDRSVPSATDQRIRRGRDDGAAESGRQVQRRRGARTSPGQAGLSAGGPALERVQRDLVGQPTKRLLTAGGPGPG